MLGGHRYSQLLMVAAAAGINRKGSALVHGLICRRKLSSVDYLHFYSSLHKIPLTSVK